MWLGGIFDSANKTEIKEDYAQVDYSLFCRVGAVKENQGGRFKTRARSFTQTRAAKPSPI